LLPLFDRGIKHVLPYVLSCLQTRRRLLVIAYYTAIVSLFTLFGVLIIPDVVGGVGGG